MTNSHDTARKVTISRSRRISPLSLSLLVAPMLAYSAFGQTLTTLHSFGSTPKDGAAPDPGVVVDTQGNVFGTTGVGGGNGADGTVFELSPPAANSGTWTETILHRFRGTPDGDNPQSRLVMTPKGALFGTTARGGANGLGTAYRVTPGQGGKAATERVIHDFGSGAFDVMTPNLGFLLVLTEKSCSENSVTATLNESDGSDCIEIGDEQDVPGKILVGADQGGSNNTGAVYVLTPSEKGTPWKETILYNFRPLQSGDAADPSGELVLDSKGNLYGVTAQGGANNLGAVYEVSPPAVKGKPWTEKVLFSFNGTDGTLPAGRLLLGPSGQLYGTTNSGGSGESGTVFELTPPRVPGNPWTETILYAFSGGADGGSPENGVISDDQGRLFGTAADTVFMLTPPPASGAMWKETVLHTFTGPDGFTASTPLTLFKNALYGTTLQAGAFGAGTAFQLTLP